VAGRFAARGVFGAELEIQVKSFMSRLFENAQENLFKFNKDAK
jgi:hypothetical protein